MNKKFYMYLIFLFCITFNIMRINADYKCTYEVGKYTAVFDFNEKEKTVKGTITAGCNFLIDVGGCFAKEVDYAIIQRTETFTDEVKESLLKEREENFFSGYCDTTVLVGISFSNSTQQRDIEFIFNDTLEAIVRDNVDSLQGFGSGMYNEFDIKNANFIKDESTAPPKNIAYDCKSYGILFGDISEYANSIKNCSENCLHYYGQYNKAKQNLKDFCAIQYKHLDYGASCLSACLDSEEEIKKLGIEKFESELTCGFSEKLIIWIANIVKWGKYLIPVVVIVLGILDFIKAISSEKEDEMKKAQGSFVRRLIAAALIFILPFIIEFVLNKMGFIANGCGIIDL